MDNDKYDQVEFKTLGGRIVKSYGGITPDVEVVIEPESEAHSALLAKDMYFKFANYYIENNPGLKIAVPDDELFIQFKNYLTSNNFSYESQIEKKLKEIEQLASEKSYKLEIKDMLDKVEVEAESGEQKEIDLARDEILLSIVDEINTKIITDIEQIEAAFPFDIQLIEAVKIMENKPEYNRLLGK